MALTRSQKEDQVQDLTEKMQKASSLIFAHYIGLSVGDVSELRGKLREANAEMKVAKKTLMKLAAKEAGLPDFAEVELDGPVSIIFSFDDPLSGAQAAFTFSKNHDQVALIGGLFDGKILSKEEALAFAKMPSREQLLASFVGMIRSPLVSFASMCNSPLSGFARALSQMADKGGFTEKSGSTEAEAEAPKEEAATKPTANETPAEESTEEKPESDPPAEGTEPRAETASADAEETQAEEASDEKSA